MNVDKEAFKTAICDGKVDDVERILEAAIASGSGADIAARLLRCVYGDRKETALHLAVRYGQENIVELLLQRHEFKVNAVDRHQCTALHVAAGVDAPENNFRIIQLLLGKEGISVDAEEKYGYTALKLAAEKGDYGVVKLLIDHKADISKSDETNNTAVHISAKNGHADVLRILLSSGKDKVARIIGQQNKNNDTPLHLAADGGHHRCVALLLFHGAATTISTENMQKQTPLDLAKGNCSILRLLNDPSTARKVVEDMLRGEVLPDSADEGGKHQQVGRNSIVLYRQALTDVLKAMPSSSAAPTTVNVHIKQEHHTSVHGGFVTIGSGSHINMADSTAVAENERAISTCESSYETKVTGGKATIGDGSVTYVGTLSPSTSPSSARSSSSEIPFSYDPRKPVQEEGAVGTTGPMRSDSCSRKPNSPGTDRPQGTVCSVETACPKGTPGNTASVSPVGTSGPKGTLALVETEKCGPVGISKASRINGPRGTVCSAVSHNHTRMSGLKETTSPIGTAASAGTFDFQMSAVSSPQTPNPTEAPEPVRTAAVTESSGAASGSMGTASGMKSAESIGACAPDRTGTGTAELRPACGPDGTAGLTRVGWSPKGTTTRTRSADCTGSANPMESPGHQISAEPFRTDSNLEPRGRTKTVWPSSSIKAPPSLETVSSIGNVGPLKVTSRTASARPSETLLPIEGSSPRGIVNLEGTTGSSATPVCSLIGTAGPTGASDSVEACIARETAGSWKCGDTSPCHLTSHVPIQQLPQTIACSVGGAPGTGVKKQEKSNDDTNYITSESTSPTGSLMVSTGGVFAMQPEKLLETSEKLQSTNVSEDQNSYTSDVSSARAKDKEKSSLKTAEKGKTESVRRVALTGNLGKPLQFYTTAKDSESRFETLPISVAPNAGAGVKDSIAEEMPSNSLRCTAGSTPAIYEDTSDFMMGENENESSARPPIEEDSQCWTPGDMRQPLLKNTSCSVGEDFEMSQSSPVLGQRQKKREETRKREPGKSCKSESQLGILVENADPSCDSKGKEHCSPCGII